MINEAQLIAQQALTIANLEEQVAELKAAQERAALMFVCIGGPLNDNVLGFNVEQRKYLHRIYDVLEQP